MRRSILLLLFLYLSCKSETDDLEGMWQIVYTIDTHDNQMVHRQILSSNVIEIRLNSKNDQHGYVPAVRGEDGLGKGTTPIKEIQIKRSGSEQYLQFVLTGENNVFDKPFNIIFLNSDSFLIKSDRIEIKCKKWF